jgi:hypothetical protein
MNHLRTPPGVRAYMVHTRDLSSLLPTRRRVSFRNAVYYVSQQSPLVCVEVHLPLLCLPMSSLSDTGSLTDRD